MYLIYLIKFLLYLKLLFLSHNIAAIFKAEHLNASVQYHCLSHDLNLYLVIGSILAPLNDSISLFVYLFGQFCRIVCTSFNSESPRTPVFYHLRLLADFS